MKADITRDTFDPGRNFSAVVALQGRPVLDADLNEQAAIHRHYQRALAVDLIGPHGGPNDDGNSGEVLDGDDGLGFNLFPKLKDLPPAVQASLPPNFPLGDKNVFLGRGRYWVYGLLCEAKDYFLLGLPDDQPDPPVPVQPNLPTDPDQDLSKLKGNQFYLIYLDVWERYITAIGDERILESALGGVETSGRLKVVYQVRFKLVEHQVVVNLLKEPDRNQAAFLKLLGIDSSLPADSDPSQLADRLRAQAVGATPSGQDPDCPLDPEARYHGDENRLYRVEIHRGGPATEATFVWARDNASVVLPIRSAQGGEVTLESLGLDASQAIEPGQWVEILDDDMALRHDPEGKSAPAGDLYQVTDVDTDHFVVKLAKPPGSSAPDHPSYLADGTKHPLLRRWDHFGGPKAGEVPTDPDLNVPPLAGGALKVQESDKDWIDLEDGIQIQFPTAETIGVKQTYYRVGDYWLIPARIATGDVEWPTTVGKDGHWVRQAVPPRRNRRYYAPLWILHTDNDGNIQGWDAHDLKPKDCRRRIKRPIFVKEESRLSGSSAP